MRKSRHFFFLLVAISVCNIFAAAQNQEKEIDKSKNNANSLTTVKYDKSKDLTTVRSKRLNISKIGQEKAIANNIPLHQMDLEMSFSYSGQQLTKQVDKIILRFHAVAGNYTFLKGQPIIAVLNRDIKGQDRALGLGTTDYKSVVPKFNSVYEEFLSIEIPPNVLTKISEAKTVEIYVGPVNYQFTPEQHNVIKEISLRLKPLSSTVTTKN